MKTSVTLAAIIVLAILGCGKDKFQTVPSLRVKSVSTDVVPLNGSLRVTLEFTDKEGDVHDSIWVKKKRINLRTTATLRDSLVYKIPTYPDKNSGEFEITLDFQSILSAINPPNIPGSNPPRKEPDTLNVKFAVRDKAGHISDSVSIGQIVVLRSL
jgi:hypothetical protein